MKAQKIFERAVESQLKGDFSAAKRDYQVLLRKEPHNSEILGNLAAIVRQEGQTAAAEQLLGRALRANPRNVAAMATLGNLRLLQNRPDDAMELSERALAIVPNYPEALINRGVVHVHRNQFKRAEASFQQALHFDPANDKAKMNLANSFRLQKLYLDETTAYLENLVAEKPDYAEALVCLAAAYQDKHRFAESTRIIRRAWEIDRRPGTLFNYANCLLVMGESEEALACYDEAIRLDPNDAEINTTRLFAINYDQRMTAEQVYDEYRRYGQRFASKTQFDHSGRETTNGRKIRIGYTSADFCAHVVLFFLTPIIATHDRAQFETFAYSSVVKEDSQTHQLRGMFDHWRDVLEISDADLAQRIHDDKIDILIDLSGHTAGNRLRAFAMRPAPVQATYLGYGYTTGMSEIDYFIGDDSLTPAGSEHLFSEKICRIAAPVYAYRPPIEVTGQVSSLPALEKGYVTFGSMSRLIRLNSGLLQTWRQILERVPGSKLRLDQKPFGDPQTCERVLARLERLGFTREQVELGNSTPHWSGYHHFDISLDCWPHNAGTTTFESLLMGVPVLSKRDRPSVGRLGEMVLRPLGLDEWIVDTEAEFIERAVAFASDLPALAALRTELRERLFASPFTDFKTRTRAFEDGLRSMIHAYEAQNS